MIIYLLAKQTPLATLLVDTSESYQIRISINRIGKTTKKPLLKIHTPLPSPTQVSSIGANNTKLSPIQITGVLQCGKWKAIRTIAQSNRKQ
jgi:hypothetical protein